VHQIKPEQAYYNKSNIKAREDSDGALIIAYGDRQQTANPIDCIVRLSQAPQHTRKLCRIKPYKTKECLLLPNGTKGQ